MTTEEAILELKMNLDLYTFEPEEGCENVKEDSSDGKLKKALEMGISALMRSIPQEVVFDVRRVIDFSICHDSVSCPRCVQIFNKYEKTWGSNFCPNCGQALKWEVAESKEEKKNENTDGDS